MEKLWKILIRYIKLVKKNKKRSHSVSEPSYHKTEWFPENLLVIEMKKKMNEPVYLAL